MATGSANDPSIWAKLSNKRLLLSRVAGEAAVHSAFASRPLLGDGPCSRIARR